MGKSRKSKETDQEVDSSGFTSSEEPIFDTVDQEDEYFLGESTIKNLRQINKDIDTETDISEEESTQENATDE